MTSCQAGQGGQPSTTGPQWKDGRLGCVTRRASEGKAPSPRLRSPPQGDVRPENPGPGRLRLTPSLLRGTRPGTVPCPLPGRRARRPCPEPQACSLGLATLGTARACWAFLPGLGPSAEALILLCVLSPPRPLGEAHRGLLRSTLWPPPRPAFCPRAQLGSQEGWGYPARFSLPGLGSSRPAVGQCPPPLLPGPAQEGPAPHRKPRGRHPAGRLASVSHPHPPHLWTGQNHIQASPSNPSRPPPLGWLSPKSVSGGETEAKEGVLGLQRWPGSS